MSKTTQYCCDNCGSTDAPEIPMEEIRDLAQRLDVGRVVPAGECACGALTYRVGEPDLLAACKALLEAVSAMGIETDSPLWSEEYNTAHIGAREAIAKAGL